MGGWGVGFMVFNAMIGAGIFGLPGKLDAALGTFAPWMLLLAGVAVMGIALCYADLATRFDSSGGPQLYATSAFGEFTGFQAGWMNWSSRAAATAANASVLGSYASVFLPGVPQTALALGAILLVTLMNLAALSRVAAALGFLSLVKLIPLLLVAGLSLAAIGSPSSVALPTFNAVEGVVLAAIYAFVGFEAATVPAGETRDPRRAVPRALLATLTFVTFIYVVVQLAYSGAALGASETPLADLANIVIGPAGSLLIAATAVVSVFANISCALATMPRVTAAMADQRQLPAPFGKRSSTGSPFLSVTFYGLLAAALAASGSFVFLAVVSALARLFVYALCALAIPVLDRRSMAPFRWARGIALPTLVVAFCLWAAVQSGSDEWLTFAAFLGTGALLYVIARAATR